MFSALDIQLSPSEFDTIDYISNIAMPPKNTIGSVKNVIRAQNQAAKNAAKEDDIPQQGQKRLVKAQEKLSKANAETAAIIQGAAKGQQFHDEISKCVLGYAYWPSLSETGFGTLPELLRGTINARAQERQSLLKFWNSTNEGRSLKNHEVEKAITILVSPQTLELDSITFDTRHIKTIAFKPEWRGRLAEECDIAQHEQLPVLGDGGHRLDLLREFVYKEKLAAHADLIQQIAKIDATGKGKRSREPLVNELEKLQEELLTVTWIAKVLDKDKIEAHPEGHLIKIEIASNKNQFQVPEKAQNSLSLFFDALNAIPGVHADNIQKVLESVVERTDKTGQRVCTVVSSVHLTYAYARLCYNHYFRQDMPFTVSALHRWRRAIGAYAIVYIRWMALTFEVLFSYHELTNFPMIPQLPEAYFAAPETQATRAQLCQKLSAFDVLDVADKKIRFDILNDEFYQCLLTAFSVYKDKLDIFGFDFTQLTPDTKAQYEDLYHKYIALLDAGINSWTEEIRPRYANDADAIIILEQLVNKVHWITEGQVGNGVFHPMASQFEPLARAYLAPTTYNPGNPTLYSVLENIQHGYNPDATPDVIALAIHEWLGTMFRFRFSGLDDIRRYNVEEAQKLEKQPSGPPAPSYVRTTPRYTGAAAGDPTKLSIAKVTSLLHAIIDQKGESNAWRDLTSLDGEYKSTNEWLLKRVIQRTIYPWKDFGKGTGNRSYYLQNIARHFWMAAHAPYAIINDDDENTTNEDNIHRGWDTPYFENVRVRHILSVLTAWVVWYTPGPLKISNDDVTAGDALAQGFGEDIANYHSMRSLDTQIEGINRTLQAVYNIFMRNPVLHCLATDPVTEDAIKTLKPSVARALGSVYEACKEELGHTAKHLVQDVYNYEVPISRENRAMINDRIVVLHDSPLVPTHSDLVDWHSPRMMAELNRTERDVDRDLARLANARLKRSKTALAAAPREITLRRGISRGSSSTRTRGVSASQQARDVKLIERVEREDAEERAAAAKALDLTNPDESDDDNLPSLTPSDDDLESEDEAMSNKTGDGNEDVEDEEDTEGLVEAVGQGVEKGARDVLPEPVSSSIESLPGNQEALKITPASKAKSAKKGKKAAVKTRQTPARGKRALSDAADRDEGGGKKTRTRSGHDVAAMIQTMSTRGSTGSGITVKGDGIKEAYMAYYARINAASEASSSQARGSALDTDFENTPEA
ncbi:hypothetical protein C0993_004587 [Termitomyces sp. T159_Od127]|nr:hypothetical protein C0993_004587 [Termitomyces sp. T159_Od127]